MDTQALLKERIDLVHQAIKMDSVPKRIINKGNVFGWMNAFDEEPINTVLRDFDLLERDLRNFCETYQFDLIDSVGFRNIPSVLDLMGNSIYSFNDEDRSVYTVEFDFMKDDEYPLIKEDLFKYIWEKLMPRKFEVLNDDEKGMRALYDACIELSKIFEKKEEWIKMIREDYGIECAYAPEIPAPILGFDMLFFMFRGIKPISIDLRRRPKELIEACQVIDELLNEPILNDPNIVDGSDENLLYDYNLAMMSQTILSRKQFDQIYGPILTKLFKHIVDHKKTVRFFVEGSFGRFLDYLQDIPKGHLAVEFENDNIFELRKQLPNACVIGGMPTLMLGNGTEQECVDYAKKLCDELGTNGGYIMSQDKMMQYRNDAKPENLKAVSDFVREYRA